MILPSTVSLAMDNSGARRIRCLRVFKKPGRGRGTVGDLLRVVVLRLRNRGHIRVKVGELYVAIVTRVCVSTFRMKKGYFFKFDSSRVVLLNKKGTPIGTRVFGPCPKELRSRKNLRIITLSTGLL